MTDPGIWTCAIAGAATLGVVLRPFGWPEAVWAVAGAALLVLLGLLPTAAALAGVGHGADVYLFLTGMMLLSEVARREGLFDWLAAVATRRAGGSPTRLFLLVYLVGTLITVFLSNDATAVVLTPAVAAAAKTAESRDPLPYLFVCAFVANAASFVLPISNPANLVIYGSHMPALAEWLPRFALPSLAAIAVTYAVLRLVQNGVLKADEIASEVEVPKLSGDGRLAASGIAATGAVLLAASGFGIELGLPTALCGALTAAAVLIRRRASPWSTVKDISWGVLPLVAGLFVLVEALDRAGLIAALARLLGEAARRSAGEAAWGAGVILGLACNLVNNLPAGLIAGDVVGAARVPERVTSAILIGVDLGPNLSVTGSLATLLWLTALRREGVDVGAGRFLKLGLLAMPPALVLAIAALFLF